MASWSIMALEVACIFLTLLHTVVPEAIMCSRCDSRHEKTRDCQHNPPIPTRCSASSDMQQFCITARELNENRTLIAFIRDCSTTKMGNECKKMTTTMHMPNSPHEICYETCDYDGCNGAFSLVRMTGLQWPLVASFLTCQLVQLIRGQVWSIGS